MFNGPRRLVSVAAIFLTLELQKVSHSEPSLRLLTYRVHLGKASLTRLKTGLLVCFSDFTGLPDVPGIAPLPSFVASPLESQPSRPASKIIFPEIRFGFNIKKPFQFRVKKVFGRRSGASVCMLTSQLERQRGLVLASDSVKFLIGQWLYPYD